MSNAKKLSFAIILALIISGVWYLESMKAAPMSGSGGAGHAINIPEEGSAQGQPSSSPSSSAGSDSPSVSAMSMLQQLAAADKQAGYQPAIEIADPTGFVNTSSSFTLSSLVGKKVILLDFWTYSCINCIRTIPYLDAWYQKYASSGLEIVGIHSPEFGFEKDINNVSTAVVSDGIKYPVILDSNYGTWNAYQNHYWPHEYLIDLAGYIVHDRVGEGGYADTEAEIQKLLAERADILGAAPAIPTSTVNVAPANLGEIQSPETYFNSERNDSLANGTSGVSGMQTFMLPSGDILANRLYLGGTWDIGSQYATNVSAGAKVEFKYDSGKVYFVASGAPAGTAVEVLQDGAPIAAADAGSDVRDGKLIVTGSRLYNVVDNHDGGGEHTLELIIDGPGLEAFTFTFG